MSKRKWRRGKRIPSIQELTRQEIVFWFDKPMSHGWFMSWPLRMAETVVGERGVVFYAMPAGVSTRFSDEDVIRAERRMHTAPTLEGRKELIGILNRFDRGLGDVDDVIDAWENDPGY